MSEAIWCPVVLEKKEEEAKNKNLSDAANITHRITIEQSKVGERLLFISNDKKGTWYSWVVPDKRDIKLETRKTVPRSRKETNIPKIIIRANMRTWRGESFVNSLKNWWNIKSATY